MSDNLKAIRDKRIGKIGRTQVKRHWPGKPHQRTDDADEGGDIRMVRVVALEKAYPGYEDSAIVNLDDPRLRRLAESRIGRRIRLAEIVSMEKDENRRNEEVEAEEEDEDALAERRRRIKEKMLQREQEETPFLEEKEEVEVEEEEEEESEVEKDSEAGIVIAKVTFVPKSKRETIDKLKRLKAEEEAEKKKLDNRKTETRQIVVEMIREYTEIQRNVGLEVNVSDVDTDDEVSEAKGYETWKTREIARIKRDREESEAKIKEREEIKKARIMTEDERGEWEKMNPKPAPPPKQKRKFMQKDYRKGAFYQTEADDPTATAGTDNIYHRDFSAPTGDDKMDKTILPKIMQVKRFGRRGRTKWTHLVSEDTTYWSNPYVLYARFSDVRHKLLDFNSSIPSH